MGSNAFASLCVLSLPPATRLLHSACCPDKDLVALISRLGNKDKLSLWTIQGSKSWEVDVGSHESATQIVGIAWSPDGQSVAVAHEPPLISIHSLQDGRAQLTLPIIPTSVSQRRPLHITDIWWFSEKKTSTTSSIPDIFKRNDIVTGTALSILKSLPLLDNIQEDSQKMTATDIFAFQGSQVRAASKLSLPDVIRHWPTLHSDLYAASISSALHGRAKDSAVGTLEEVDDSNLNSILSFADDLGHIHCFLDGSFPLGTISIGSDYSIGSLFKHSTRPMFYVHPRAIADNTTTTALHPGTIEIPLLGERKARDLARLASTSRELVWYTIRVVKEMRSVWFGSESFSGARELGPKWIRMLETKQKELFGQEDPNPILDLTCLLATGRASDSLLDFLGSGEQMSERGIQKWESTVTEALAKLRDFSEKRIAPACQRLHLVLEEVQGWSQLPQYTSFELSVEDLNGCLDLTNRAIIIASWLAAVARRELCRFKEFIAWLRFESAAANPTSDSNASPHHDILEVNNYFMSGLVVSSIDKWFMGPVPQFSPRDFGILRDDQSMPTVLGRARAVANDPTQMTWQANITQKDLNHLDRNLDALVQELALRCQRVFERAAAAAARSAIVSLGRNSAGDRAASSGSDDQSHSRIPIRERIIAVNEGGNLLQYLVIRMPSEYSSFLCLVRLHLSEYASNVPLKISVAILECYLPEEENEGNQLHLDLLEADFFDDECVVIVCRLRSTDKLTFIATVSYNDLGYQELQSGGYVTAPAREDLMRNAMEGWKQGQFPAERIPIKRRRALTGSKTGGVTLAVNGRVGRRIACVLDSQGTALETFDMEGDGEDTEDEEGEGEGEE